MTRLRKTSLLLLALDFAVTLVAFNVVGYYRGVGEHFIVSPLVVPACFLAFAIYLVDGYKERTEMQHLDYASLHVIAALGAMLATLLLTFVLFPAGYELQQSRAVIALSFLVLIPVTLGYRRLIGQRATASRSGRSLLFVGDAASREAFRLECEKMGMTQYVIYATLHPVADDQHVANFSSVLAAIQTGRSAVEAIVLRESHRDLGPDMAHTLMELYFGGVPTFTLELFHQVYWQKIPLYRINPTWLFQEGFQIAREPVFERIKRASDVLLAGAGLVLASPVILGAALLVWAQDRHSPWFSQRRIGRYQVPFQLCKIRTMRPNSPGGDLYTRTNDPRITRIGSFLRRSRIDELPQLWNVLRGDMSLIGPRAEWDRLVSDYERNIPCYSYRHLVKPGITGWAQINYPYGASLEDTLRKLEYDLYYIRHFSFVLDASIAVRTIQIMMFGKGR